MLSVFAFVCILPASTVASTKCSAAEAHHTKEEKKGEKGKRKRRKSKSSENTEATEAKQRKKKERNGQTEKAKGEQSDEKTPRKDRGHKTTEAHHAQGVTPRKTRAVNGNRNNSNNDENPSVEDEFGSPFSKRERNLFVQLTPLSPEEIDSAVNKPNKFIIRANGSPSGKTNSPLKRLKSRSTATRSTRNTTPVRKIKKNGGTLKNSPGSCHLKQTTLTQFVVKRNAPLTEDKAKDEKSVTTNDVIAISDGDEERAKEVERESPSRQRGYALRGSPGVSTSAESASCPTNSLVNQCAASSRNDTVCCNSTSSNSRSSVKNSGVNTRAASHVNWQSVKRKITPAALDSAASHNETSSDFANAKKEPDVGIENSTPRSATLKVEPKEERNEAAEVVPVKREKLSPLVKREMTSNSEATSDAGLFSSEYHQPETPPKSSPEAKSRSAIRPQIGSLTAWRGVDPAMTSDSDCSMTSGSASSSSESWRQVPGFSAAQLDRVARHRTAGSWKHRAITKENLTGWMRLPWPGTLKSETNDKSSATGGVLATRNSTEPNATSMVESSHAMVSDVTSEVTKCVKSSVM